MILTQFDLYICPEESSKVESKLEEVMHKK
jgi:hypothetical protein